MTLACAAIPSGALKGAGEDVLRGCDGAGAGAEASLGRLATQLPSILKPTLPPLRQTPSSRTISAVDVAVIFLSTPSIEEFVSTVTVTVLWAGSTDYAVTVALLREAYLSAAFLASRPA